MLPPPDDITKLIEEDKDQNTTGFPLTLPQDFSISIFASDLEGARVIVQDGLGNFWLSRTKEGIISQLIVRDGEVAEQHDIFKDLKRPHGLAVDPQDPFLLYFAEEDKISKVRLYSEGEPELIKALPEGGRHFTRTLMFGPDDKLYVSIGSSCDACQEEDNLRAKIFVMDRDGSGFEEFASGLRNAVFMDIEPITGKIWATEMGRDFLGDDLPPDEINIIEEGNDYGWPTCYGKNVHDEVFDAKTYDIYPCTEPEKIQSHIDLPAHSAPLGLAFIPEEGWPEEYWYDLLVAYHGSWNRTEPTGYKVVRHRLDGEGNYLGEEDFISGWLSEEGALGRPVDILTQVGGIMYITDDKAGVVYKITYSK